MLRKKRVWRATVAMPKRVARRIPLAGIRKEKSRKLWKKTATTPPNAPMAMPTLYGSRR